MFRFHLIRSIMGIFVQNFDFFLSFENFWNESGQMIMNIMCINNLYILEDLIFHFATAERRKSCDTCKFCANFWIFFFEFSLDFDVLLITEVPSVDDRRDWTRLCEKTAKFFKNFLDFEIFKIFWPFSPKTDLMRWKCNVCGDILIDLYLYYLFLR